LREPPPDAKEDGHDTATLKAFSGKGRSSLRFRRSIGRPVSLQLNSKRGIVTRLIVPAGFAFENDRKILP
jgi:hypothetical protein